MLSTPQPTRLAFPPPFEPVTLSEAKYQVKVPQSVSGHDDELNRLIVAGRVETERRVSKIAATSSFLLSYECFPGTLGSFRLPLRNVTAITTISVTDADGTTVVDAADYVLTNLGIVWPIVSPVTSWPTAPVYPFPVTIELVAGFADIDEMDQDDDGPRIKAMVLAYIDNVFNSNGEVESKTAGFGRIFESLDAAQLATYP